MKETDLIKPLLKEAGYTYASLARKNDICPSNFKRTIQQNIDKINKKLGHAGLSIKIVKK